jgi:hypothetical protein
MHPAPDFRIGNKSQGLFSTQAAVGGSSDTLERSSSGTLHQRLFADLGLR